MFNLTKEVEEVKLEYYIMKQADGGLIELTLTDISELLGVNRSKAQRLVEKFLRLNILTIEKKSMSKNVKTVYRYTQNINSATNVDTNKYSNINENIDRYDTNNEIEGDTDDTLVSIYASRFKLNSFTEETLKLYENSIDKELFEYLLDQISNRQNIISVESYLKATLEDLKENNVKTLKEYFNRPEKHKKQVRDLKKENNRKNWNYSTESRVQEDFDIMAKMTRYK